MDTSLSLQELEADDWGEPTTDSRVVMRAYRLRRIPLRQLSVDDLRLLIGQNIGMDYVVPVALDHLKDDPFISGLYYPGDLLEIVLSISPEFWPTHPNLYRIAETITEQVYNIIDDGGVSYTDNERERLRELLRRFSHLSE